MESPPDTAKNVGNLKESPQALRQIIPISRSHPITPRIFLKSRGVTPWHGDNHANLVKLPHDVAGYSGNLAKSPLAVKSHYEFLAESAVGVARIAIKPAKPSPQAKKNCPNPTKATKRVFSSPNLAENHPKSPKTGSNGYRTPPKVLRPCWKS